MTGIFEKGDGGISTGTHIHVARKFNGEWIIAAASEIPFVMEGCRAKDGENPYEGTLECFEKTINACDCATLDTNVQAASTFDGIPAAPLPSPTH